MSAPAVSNDEWSPFDIIVDEPLRKIFLLIGCIPSNCGDTQTYDLSLPLPTGYGTWIAGMKLDLQSAAALACTCKRAASVWRIVQTDELLDLLQAMVRGHYINFILACHESVFDMRAVARESTVANATVPMQRHLLDLRAGELNYLLFTDEGYIDLDASLALVESEYAVGALPRRPKGWSNVDCLLASFTSDNLVADDCGKMVSIVLRNVIRAQIAPARITPVLERCCALSRLSVRVREGFGCLEFMHITLLRRFKHWMPDTPPSWEDDNNLSLESITSDMVNLLRRQPGAGGSSCLFACLRRHIGAGVKPTLPPELFNATLQQCSLNEVLVWPQNEARVCALALIKSAIAKWPQFICWKFIRALGVALCPRTLVYGPEKSCRAYSIDNRYLEALENYSKNHIWTASARPCGDISDPCSQHCSLFGVKRHAHSRFFKLSPYGIASVADTLQRTVFRRHEALFTQCLDVPAMSDTYVEALRACAAWSQVHSLDVVWRQFAVRAQLYTAAVRCEEKTSPHTPSGGVTRVFMRARALQIVDTTTALGRTLDAIWRRIYMSKHQESECRVVCRAASATPGPRYVLPTIAVIVDANEAKTFETQECDSTTPVFALTSEVHFQHVGMSFLSADKARNSVHADAEKRRRHVAHLEIDGSRSSLREDVMRFEPLFACDLTSEAARRSYVINWSRVSALPWQFIGGEPMSERHWWHHAFWRFDCGGISEADRLMDFSSVGRMLDAKCHFENVQNRTIALLESMAEPDTFDRAFVMQVRCAACSTHPPRPNCQCDALNAKRQSVSELRITVKRQSNSELRVTAVTKKIKV